MNNTLLFLHSIGVKYSHEEKDEDPGGDEYIVYSYNYRKTAYHLQKLFNYGEIKNKPKPYILVIDLWATSRGESVIDFRFTTLDVTFYDE